jgi:hypothetical protein
VRYDRPPSGVDRSLSTVANNRFPIFAWRGRPELRYMRYWIERGHERAGQPLADEDCAALDMLDRELNDSRNVVSFRLCRGDMLFVDNTTIAHARDAFTDDPAAPRLLVRLWFDHPPVVRVAPVLVRDVLVAAIGTLRGGCARPGRSGSPCGGSKAAWRRSDRCRHCMFHQVQAVVDHV